MSQQENGNSKTPSDFEEIKDLVKKIQIKYRIKS